MTLPAHCAKPEPPGRLHTPAQGGCCGHRAADTSPRGGDSGAPGPESHPEAEAGRRAPRLNVRGGCALPVCPGQRSSSVRDPTLAVVGLPLSSLRATSGSHLA